LRVQNQDAVVQVDRDGIHKVVMKMGMRHRILEPMFRWVGYSRESGKLGLIT
jgi:hypothetical protein